MSPTLTESPRLCLSLHDELFMVDLGQTLYFMADDHYTHVFYSTGIRFMVPFSLGRIEEQLALYAVHHPHSFKRLGRKYIVNLAAIHNINTTKQQLMLLSAGGKPVTLQVSKPVLRELKSIMADSTT